MKKLNRFISIILILFTLISCRRYPQDSRLQGEWTTVQIEQGSGTEITASIFFVFDGDISYSRGNISWLGTWNTDRGVLTVSFEDSTINGSYDYKIKNQSQNTTASKPFDELELTPIEIDDSLFVNQFSGTFNSIY
jgi:hypothetical protein|tara:strand:+ start:55 stop:462 length:408 start_codon:yes stop_codon:yes gene_type:complete